MSHVHRRTHDLGLLVIRGAVGAIFAYHGAQKLFGVFGGPGLTGFAGFLGSLGLPAPYLQAVLAGSAEFFGGLALLVGLATRLAAVPLVFTMGVAVYVVSGNGFSVQDGGIEYPLVMALLLAGLALTGPGHLSFDAFLSKSRRNEANRPAQPAATAEGGVR